MTRNRKDRLPPLISLAEAGRIIGIARQNVPGAIARGELRAVRDLTGELKVTRVSALAAKERRDAARATRDTTDSASPAA